MKLVSRVLSRLRHRVSGEDGQVIIMVGLATIVMFAVVGLAVDVGRLYITKAQLSRAMDAAALAGVLELDGTSAGVTRARTVCEDYLVANEPSATGVSCDSPDENLLEAHARKDINTFFIRVIGIKSAGVTAKAKAGFGVASLDAVLVMDLTASMVGDPITNAKSAALSFKTTLLGSNPDGRTVIGLAPFRGCYRTSPLGSGQTSCIDIATQTQALTSNSATLTTKINAMTAGGGSAGTNVCNGLAKGWSILDGAGNHVGEENSRRYMILLSDGDNYYPGNYTYQAPFGTLPPSSPDGIQVAGSDYPCQPYNSCGSPWNTSPSTPCNNGVWTALTTEASDGFSSSTTLASDNFPSSCTNWSGGSGWLAGWTRNTSSGTYAPVLTSGGTPNDSSCHARILAQGWIQRTLSLSAATSATLTWYAKKTSNWDAGDTGIVEISTNGTSWTTLQTHTTSLSTSYSQFTASLDAYVGNPTVYLRFRANLNANTDSTEYFYVDTVTVTSCGGWSQGTGWAAGWTISPSSGNDTPVITTAGTPNDNPCHVRLRGTGAITRTVDLSGVGVASTTYYAKIGGWEAGDTTVVEASADGSTWTTLRTITSSASTSYTSYTDSLDAFAGYATVYLRFRGAMTTNDTGEQLYLDTITVSSGASGSSNGYLNGNDGSNPATCNESPRPRERQLDVRTYNLARAIKAQGVEIFVVAFTAPSIPGCNLGSGVVYNDIDPAECNTVLDSTPGPIGNNTSDTSSNVRLLKCIASSTDETSDHYYWAATAGDLPAVFTQIASKIAHRLVE